MSSLTVDPIAGPWALAIIFAVLVALLWMRPRFRQLTRQRRAVLAMLRGGAILMVLTTMLRPGCVSTQLRQNKALVILQLDASRSMQLPAEPGGDARWDALRKTLEAHASELAALVDQHIDVRAFTFAGSIAAAPIVGGAVELAERAEGGQSDIARAIVDAVRDSRDERLLAVILASDGVPNVAEPQYELDEAVAVLAASQTPLFTVPFGRSAETDQSADIALVGMPDQYTVWVKNNLTVTATLQGRGFANARVPVQLVVSDQQGRETIADTRIVEFRQDNEQVQVDLSYVPETPGQYRLAVRAEPQPREATERNNTLPAFLTVNEGGLRVLYLYGNLGWEQKFLRRSLAAYPDLELDAVSIDPRTRDQWPVNLARLLESRPYDVFILHDVDSRALYSAALQEENLRLLVDRVASGKGLLMIGGYHSFGPGLYHSTPLADLLPIVMERTEKQDFDAPIRRDLNIQRELELRPVGGHFITRLGGDPNAGDAWQQLPPLDGANRFLGLKDTAEVLLESTSGDPILVAAHVGGRVLCFAGDSTWKWWMQGHESEHKRFWRQVILWLAFRDALSGDNLWIDMAQRRFEPGAQVTFSTGTSAIDGGELATVEYSSSLLLPDGTQRSLALEPSGDRAIGRVPREAIEQSGIYTIEVTGRRGGATVGSARAEFMVFDNDRELTVAGADPALLARLADLTSPWGGRLVPPAEFGRLIGELAARAPELKTEVPVKWRIGDTWQDALAVVGLWLAFMTAEWFLRKRWGLV